MWSNAPTLTSIMLVAEKSSSTVDGAYCVLTNPQERR